MLVARFALGSGGPIGPPVFTAWRLAIQLSKVGELERCLSGLAGAASAATATRQEAVLGLSSALTAVTGNSGRFGILSGDALRAAALELLLNLLASQSSNSGSLRSFCGFCSPIQRPT